MEIIKNKTDRFKLSEFYKGSETDPTYVFVQQFNDKKLNSENIHIHSLSFLYHTLNSKGKLEIEKKWIDIFPTLNEVKRMKNDLNKNVMKIFNVINSVNIKTSYGGTSTKNIKKMISKLKKELK